MIHIAVNGALGKMGARILTLAKESKDLRVAGSFDKNGDELSAKALAKADVLIDFSSPEGARRSLAVAVAAKKALVIGSTGLTDEFRAELKKASKTIAIVCSANMSVGVNLIVELLASAAKKLSADFDIEITEAHHRHKKDSPSGTALMLADAIAKAKGWDLKRALRYRKDEKTDKDRPTDIIGMQVIRAGEIVGDHTVLFAGPAETIEITHRAQSRDTFARGSLVAARFLAKKKTGLYTMADVLA